MSRLNLEDSRVDSPTITRGLKYSITVLSDANATLNANMGPILYIKGTASRTITLPAATQAIKGLTYIFLNAAAFTVVVQNPTPTTVATVPATVGAVGMFVCLGDSTLGVGGWSGGL